MTDAITIREKIGGLFQAVKSGDVGTVVTLSNTPVTAPSKKRKKNKTTDKTITEPEATIPSGITKFATEGPLLGGLNATFDLWTMLLGSPKQKTEALEDWVPIDEQTYTTVTEPIIGGDEPWLDEPLVTIPGIEPFKLPEINLADIGGILSGIGTGALIFGGLILGIMLLKK